MTRVELPEGASPTGSPVFVDRDPRRRFIVPVRTPGDPPGARRILLAGDRGPPRWLAPDPAVRGAVDTVAAADGGLWTVFAEGVGTDRRIVLLGCPADGAPVAVVSCAAGRVDGPAIADLPGGGVCRVAWRREGEGGVVLETRTVALRTPDTPAPAVVLTPEPGRYGPPQIVAMPGAETWIGCDTFVDERYRVLLFAIDEVTGAVRSPRLIDGGDGHDLSPSIAAAAGALVVAWENCRSLRRGDQWIGTTIPAFGHGWRVRSRIGVCRVRLDGKTVSVEEIDADGSPWMVGGARGSSGCPRVVVSADGRVVVAWTRITPPPRRWVTEAASAEATGWRRLSVPPVVSRERRAPAILAVPGGGIATAGFSGGSDRDLTLADVALPGRRIPASWRENPLGHPPATRRRGPASVPRQRGRGRVETENGVYRPWWGDLHMHSNLSVCSLHEEFHCTDIEGKYRYARDVGGLDFAMVTDHDSMSDDDWARTVAAAEDADLPGRFTAFPGFEWTSSNRPDRANYGHYCVLRLDGGGLLRVDEPGSCDPGRLWNRLQPGAALTIPHHPSDAVHPLDWSWFDERFVRLAEVFQVRGAFEYDGNPFDPRDLGRSIVPGRSLRDALCRGYRFGFTAGGEHEGVGITGAWAAALDRRSIFEALHARRTFATTGARFTVEFRVNDRLMGSEIPPAESPEILVRVDSGVGLRRIRIVRDGIDVHQWDNPPTSARLQWTDEALHGPDLHRPHSYYAAVVRDDGETAWASPVFMAPSRPS